jgi:hypothetical protein
MAMPPAFQATVLSTTQSKLFQDKKTCPEASDNMTLLVAYLYPACYDGIVLILLGKATSGTQRNDEEILSFDHYIDAVQRRSPGRQHENGR